jgi:hypothetical protein
MNEKNHQDSLEVDAKPTVPLPPLPIHYPSEDLAHRPHTPFSSDLMNAGGPSQKSG